MSNTASPLRQIAVVNALPSGSRIVARAFGARLREQEAGTQYYRGALDRGGRRHENRRCGEGTTAGRRPTETHMVNARGSTLEICVQTSRLIGRCSTAGEGTAVHRSVALIYTDPGVTLPALVVSVAGPLQERPYYPDMLVAHDFAEIRSTADTASGFAAAVSRLCGPHEVVMLALPQDPSVLSESVRRLCAICLSLLECRPPEVRLSIEEHDSIRELARTFGASQAQRDQLMKAAIAVRIRGRSVTEAVRTIPSDSDCQRAIVHIEEFSR